MVSQVGHSREYAQRKVNSKRFRQRTDRAYRPTRLEDTRQARGITLPGYLTWTSAYLHPKAQYLKPKQNLTSGSRTTKATG